MGDEEMSLRVARELRQMLPPELMFTQSIPRMIPSSKPARAACPWRC